MFFLCKHSGVGRNEASWRNILEVSLVVATPYDLIHIAERFSIDMCKNEADLAIMGL